MTAALAAGVVAALESCLRGAARPVALHEPAFEGNEWAYLKDCLDTGWVSSAGAYVDRFEQALAEVTGLQSVAAVVNGTAALHACLRLLDVGPGDEVLVPSLTFVATANAVSYCGAVPHFVDSEERTLGVDAERLAGYLRDMAELRDGACWNRATGRRIRALVVMHTFGHPVDLDAAAEVAARFRLELVEDAAESLGTLYKGRHTGNWGRVAALSFNGNKTVTTGGGGAVCTNDRELGLRARHLTTTARCAHKWEFIHDAVGFNYRLPNINAALGCAQLEKLDELVSRKRALAQRYQAAIASLRGASFCREPKRTWYACLIVRMRAASNPRRRRPMTFNPLRRARSPEALQKGGTSCVTMAPPPINADSPMRTNWCTAAKPPTIT